MPSSASASQERDLLLLRAAGMLFLFGSVVTGVAIVMPHSPQADLTGFLGLAAAMAVAAGVLLGFADRLRNWVAHVSVALASGVVALSLYLNGERLGGPAAINEVLYLLIVLCAGYFMTRRQLAVQVAIIAVSYAIALVAIHPGPTGWTRWLIIVGACAAAAALINTLKRRNERLLAELSLLARTDSLTGLLNRQGFAERFELELERARRSGRPLTLMLGDLDGLKALNDGLGHQAGDAALRRVSEVLAHSSRAIDVAARIGGDEFALLLPATDAGDGLNLAGQIRGRLAQRSVASATITVSFGIVAFPTHGSTRDVLMLAADRALYGAKDAGRDRTFVHACEHGSEDHRVAPRRRLIAYSQPV